MLSPLLAVNELKISFRSDGKMVPVAGPVSFTLNQSETLAIVGESGSGKTVTALSILRLIPEPPGKISEGEILFSHNGNSMDILKLEEAALQTIRGRFISMVFQEPMTSLNPVYTCGSQVAEVMQIHLGMNRPESKKRVLHLFEEVLLPDPERIFRAYPHELSGGQKQRVMIAMAIACDPAILIADEPTTALDVTVQKAILTLLKGLQQSRKMSVIFITHDLGLVAGFADRVIVMNHGKIVEEGMIPEIFQNPVDPYTRGLLACRPPLSNRPERLPTVESYIRQTGKPEIRLVTSLERQESHKRLYAQEPILRVEAVAKRFKTAQVLKPGSFHLYPGETLGIVGESGCGKTTLARVILELIPPSEGKIFYRDEDITQLKHKQFKSLRKDLQIIFQDPYSSLNPRIAIGRAILEPMKVHGLHTDDRTRSEKVVELLEKVGLGSQHYNRYPHEFSGGQRQRICIARALAVEPKLIICDESVSALDVSIQAQVLNLLNDLKREFGLTYIFISHDLSVVKYMSDRVIVMKDGRIEETGEADELYRSPKTDYTRKLLASIPK
jgi:peptide/nickel transport system ATP-binding protein